MHKRLLNEAILEFSITPAGPILVKAGETGVDPTRPDMEFVRTWRGGEWVVYLPGSSLKGVLRAHAERIVRTVDAGNGRPLACNPVGDDACGKYLERKSWPSDRVYRESCFVCRVFGNTALASRLRTADAYPVDVAAIHTEERNGVAIDRVFGAVAVGPFNFEVVTAGEFATRLHLKNFTLAQLGLLALTLRDLKLRRVGLGFAKSRGLGQVTAAFQRFTLRYPACEMGDAGLTLPGRDKPVVGRNELAGVGAFGVPENYGFPAPDQAPLPEGATYMMNDWNEVELVVEGDEAIENLWRQCIVPWREAIHL